MKKMTKPFRVSAGQFAPGEDKAANLQAITELVENAAADGVRVLILPELAMYRRIDADIQEMVANAESLEGPFTTAILELSKQHSLLIAIGILERLPKDLQDDSHAYNTLVIADKGEILHAYRKVHLYDAFASKESDSIRPGDDLPPVIDVEGFRIGFAICYDIRFPEYFRIMADQDADIIAIATAWARGIGKEEHWDVLTRCRAIENTAYVVASGEASSKSVGRSRIIDPFGYSLGDAGEQTLALVTSDVRRARLDEVRSVLPSLRNRRVAVTHHVKEAIVV